MRKPFKRKKHYKALQSKGTQMKTNIGSSTEFPFVVLVTVKPAI